MKPEEAANELERRAESLRQAQPDAQAIVRGLHEVASVVRATAARSGDSIGIRVLSRREGVRITVTGPRSARYKSLIQTEMDRRMPGITAEIRTMLTRKLR